MALAAAPLLAQPPPSSAYRGRRAPRGNKTPFIPEIKGLKTKASTRVFKNDHRRHPLFLEVGILGKEKEKEKSKKNRKKKNVRPTSEKLNLS